MVSACVRRKQVAYVRRRGISLRRACALLQVARSTVGYESALVKRDAPVAAGFTAGLPHLAPRYLKGRRIWAESRKLIRAARALPNLFRFPYEEVMAEPLVDPRARVGLPGGGCPSAW